MPEERTQSSKNVRPKKNKKKNTAAASSSSPSNSNDESSSSTGVGAVVALSADSAASKQEEEVVPLETNEPDDDDAAGDEDSVVDHGDGRNKNDADEASSRAGNSTEDETMEADNNKGGGGGGGGFAPDDDEMPLFHYSRIQGSLPRPSPTPSATRGTSSSSSLPFAVDCTCSIMGKVVLNADSLVAESVVVTDNSSSSSSSTNPSDHPTHREALALSTRDLLAQQKNQPPIPVAALGFQDGTVRLMDPQTAILIAHHPNQLAIREPPQAAVVGLPLVGNNNINKVYSVAALSMDASGCFLAAIDTGGMCTIFEFRFAFEMVQPTTTTSQQQAQTPVVASQTPPPRRHQPQHQTPQQTPQQPHHNVFSSFMSVIKGNQSFTAGSSDSTNTNNNIQNASLSAQESTGGAGGTGEAVAAAPSNANDNDATPAAMIPMLQVASVVAHRVAYPKSFGRPTCLALDPAYKKRREKSMIVGFADGRLVMTKRGFVFQRRNDAVLYQGVPATDAADNGNNTFAGIEALTWRGSLVAWADSSGIRLFDADNQTRIAHVDRPIGARPSLYPLVRNMKPTLCFETSSQLLVAWGDCLLQVKIRETSPLQPALVATAAAAGNNAAATASSPTRGSSTGGPEQTMHTAAVGSPGPPAAVRRRAAEVAMAWELDCVACSMAPLDADHVLVLGLVTPMKTGGADNDTEQEHQQHENGDGVGGLEGAVNDVELQVVSRKDGSVVYSDLLPMLRKPLPQRSPTGKIRKPESAAAYSLLSSYSLPRMDDAMEIQEDAPDVDDDDDEYDPYQVTLFGAAAASKKTFRDSHLRWNLRLVSYEDESSENIEEVESNVGNDAVRGGDDDDNGSDTSSVDSDDYSFVLRPLPPDANSRPISSKPAIPPTLVIASSSDAVSARVRCVDDAVAYALADRKPALALQRAIRNLPRLRKYNIDDLVNEYFCSLLRIPKEGDEDADQKNDQVHLSLRRMKLAAAAMPVLMGGGVALWEHWIEEIEDIPGALFIIRNVVPVRDPILSKKVYGNALQCMFTNAVQMRASADTDDTSERLIAEAESHFLNTLLQWGTTQVLNEHVKLYKYLVDLDPTFSATLDSLEDSLRRRFKQTAAVYLSFPARDVGECSNGEFHGNPAHNDSLYDVDAMMEFLEAEDKVKTSDFDLGLDRRYSRVALDAKAELSMMTGQVDRALRYYLTRGGLHSSSSIEAIERDALAAVQAGFQGTKSRGKHSYAFVLSLIENKHLFQCLLDDSFLSKEAGTLPLIALIRLAGLELAGGFLMEHCVAPQKETKIAESSGQTRSSDRTGGERRGTLPLDLVAAQLEASPKLLYWYLHLVFVRNPDLYVRFPNTANPPPLITALHRKALDLYINYAGEHRDSVRSLLGVEPYRVSEVTTPLLSFLKVVLQLGGISPTSVGKMLQIERKGGVFSRVFALELAYIMEHFGEETEDDARLILDLYLKGTQSMMLTVSYVQRALEHCAGLWEILIQHCLTEGGKPSSAGSTIDGTLFGSLLEAAGLCGADLAKLVEQIPPGMSIVGLRPRLVAAVADYRMKLQTHQSASQVAATEKIDLLRELAHRSRRGMRYEPSDQVRPPAWATFKEEAAKVATRNTSTDMLEAASEQAELESPSKLSRSLRPKQRQDRHYLSYSLQIR